MTRKRLSGSPIKAKKDELAKQEADLRRQMEDLEQIIAEAPKIAEAELERKKQEQIARASTRRSPLDSPDILEDVRHETELFTNGATGLGELSVEQRECGSLSWF